MANVIYGGGMLSCDNGSVKYLSGSSGMSGILESALISNGSPKSVAINPSDADAYVNDNGKIHVYKTCCNPMMKCTYTSGQTSVKLFSNNDGIWYSSFDNGNFTIASDYDAFSSSTERMADNTANYLNVVSGIAEYSFTEDRLNTHQTPIGMFSGCTDLKTCEIPCQLRHISNATFSGCTQLLSYTKNPDFVESIGDSAFTYCTSMREILIPRYSSIGSYAFANCTTATTINWDGITDSGDTKCGTSQISDGAFLNCTNLRYTKFNSDSDSSDEGIILPKGIETIGISAFSNVTEATALHLGDVKTIGDSAFTNDTKIINVSSVNSIETIGNSAFKNCTALTTFDLSSNTTLTSIAPNAFSSASSLTSITITSNTSKIIGNSAFRDCISLSSVTLNGATTLGNVFTNCRKLHEITANDVTSISGGTFANCGDTGTTYGLEVTESSFPDLVTINDRAFSGAQFSVQSLKFKAVFPKVTTVSSNTFANSNIEVFQVGTSSSKVSSCKFASNAFSGSNLLTDIYLYCSVKAILTSAFSGLSNNITVHVPSNLVSTYENDTFWGNYAIVSL